MPALTQGSLPPCNYDDLYVFLTLIEGRDINLSRVSEALGINQTTLYRRLLRLERDLDCALFHRHNGTYQLTAEGSRLAAGLGDLYAEMKRARGALSGDIDRVRQVNLVSLSIITSLVMQPLILSYLRARNDVQLNVVVSENAFDVVSEQTDLVIYLSRNGDELPHREPLAKTDTRLHATRGYLRGRPGYGEANFFTGNDFVLSTGSFMNKDISSWLRSRVPLERQVCKFSTMMGVFEGVRSGMGIGVLPTFAARNSPNLVALSDDNISPHLSVWIGSNRNYGNDETLSGFVTHVKNGIRDSLSLETL